MRCRRDSLGPVLRPPLQRLADHVGRRRQAPPASVLKILTLPEGPGINPGIEGARRWCLAAGMVGRARTKRTSLRKRAPEGMQLCLL